MAIKKSEPDSSLWQSCDEHNDNVWEKKGNYRFQKGKGTITFKAKGASGPLVAHSIGLIKTGE